MKKAIITVSPNNPDFRSVDCLKSCTKEEREACIHCECFRRIEKAYGGLALCPLLKNGIEIVDEGRGW